MTPDNSDLQGGGEQGGQEVQEGGEEKAGDGIPKGVGALSKSLHGCKTRAHVYN